MKVEAADMARNRKNPVRAKRVTPLYAEYVECGLADPIPEAGITFENSLAASEHLGFNHNVVGHALRMAHADGEDTAIVHGVELSYVHFYDLQEV